LELRKVVNDLMTDCPYDNVVVDTITNIRKQDIALMSDNYKPGADKATKNLTWDDWAEIKNAFLNSFNLLLTLTEKENGSKNVVFTAWESSDKITKADGAEVTRFLPDTGHKFKDDLNPITGLVSSVGRMTIGKEEIRYIDFMKSEEKPLLGDRYERKFCEAKDLLNGKTTSKKVVEVPTGNSDTKATPADTDAGKVKNNNTKIEGEK